MSKQYDSTLLLAGAAVLLKEVRGLKDDPQEQMIILKTCITQIESEITA